MLGVISQLSGPQGLESKKSTSDDGSSDRENKVDWFHAENLHLDGRETVYSILGAMLDICVQWIKARK
jgi:hypothetical protein